jgi:cell division transport system permease protein
LATEPRIRKKKKLGSFPFLNVLFSTALALFVIGLFGLLLIFAYQFRLQVEENVEVQVYLQKGISESNQARIQKILSAKPYVGQNEGRPKLTFISKEEAAQDFFEDTGEDVVSFLGENPLLDAFSLRLAPGYYQPDSLKKIKADISQLSGVAEVDYLESLVESVNRNVTRLSIILLAFGLILLLIVIVLINNTIKLALFSQRFLIRSMQLVGATGSFIRKPFLYRAAFYGMLAGLFAGGLLYAFLYWAFNRFRELETLYRPDWLLMLLAFLLFLGMMLSFFSTLRAMNKYLRLSLDELY